MKHVIRIIAFAAITILVALVMVGLAAPTPSTDPPKYQPTEVHALRLKVAQQSALLAQRDVQDAQQRFQQAMAALRDEGEKVKAEEKWPKDVVFDVGTLTFVAPQPPQAAPEKKP